MLHRRRQIGRRSDQREMTSTTSIPIPPSLRIMDSPTAWASEVLAMKSRSAICFDQRSPLQHRSVKASFSYETSIVGMPARTQQLPRSTCLLAGAELSRDFPFSSFLPRPVVSGAAPVSSVSPASKTYSPSNYQQLRSLSMADAPHSVSFPVRDGNTFTPLVDLLPTYKAICNAADQATRSVWVVISFIDPKVWPWPATAQSQLLILCAHLLLLPRCCQIHICPFTVSCHVSCQYRIFSVMDFIPYVHSILTGMSSGNYQAVVVRHSPISRSWQPRV